MGAHSAVLAVPLQSRESLEETLEQKAKFMFSQFQLRIERGDFFRAAVYIAGRLLVEQSNESPRTQYIRHAFQAALEKRAARQCELIAAHFRQEISNEQIDRLQELKDSLPGTMIGALRIAEVPQLQGGSHVAV